MSFRSGRQRLDERVHKTWAKASTAFLLLCLVGGSDAHQRTLADRSLARNGGLRKLLRSQPKVHRVPVAPGQTAELKVIEDSDTLSPTYGLTLCWISFPARNSRMFIRDVRKLGKAKSTFEELADNSDLVIVNGGFFRSDSAGKLFPIGLVISESKLSSRRASWKSGGVLMQSGDSMSITPIASYKGGPSIESAIQSKPILVTSGRIAIWSDDHKTFNRTAVGLGTEGNIVVAGAFEMDGKALSLYEFAEFLATSRSLGGPEVKLALAFDGGPGAHLFFPSLGLHFGDLGDNYVPNTIHFRRKGKQ